LKRTGTPGQTNPEAQPPHALSLWSDYAKTIIGLATGVLAILATFATSFFEKVSGLWASITLGGTCILLLAAIVLSMFVAGHIIDRARTDLRSPPALRQIAALSNVSFAALFLGMMLLFVFLIVAELAPERDAEDALKVAMAFRDTSCPRILQKSLRSIELASAKTEWHVVLILKCAEKQKTNIYSEEISVRNGKIVDVRTK
jgi:hypothetical protein